MTTRFTLHVESNGAALADDPDYAMADLLRGLANVIGCRGTFDGEGTVRDGNGNTVGRWTMTAGPDDATADRTAQHGQPFEPVPDPSTDDGYECPECGAVRPAMRHTAGCPNY